MKLFNKALLATLLTGALLTACQDDEFVGEVAPRLFSPVNFTQVDDIIEVQLTWQTVQDAVGYTVEMAADSSFTEVLFTYQTEETFLEPEGLEYETKHVPRVKANAADPAMDSKYTIGKPFTTGNAPVVIKSAKEVGRDYVILTWDASYTVDNLRLAPLSDTDNYVDYAISAEAQAAAELRIDGLEAATTYQAIIMKGRNRYNKTSFRTKDALPAGTIEVPAGADLAEYITQANAMSGAAVLLLPEGSEYELPKQTVISNDLTIISEGSVKPLLRIKQLNIAGSLGTVTFENIAATGELLTVAEHGDYFIKFLGSGDDMFDHMEELVLRDVEIYNFSNAVVRHDKKSGGFGKLTVEKALIHEIGTTGQNYALFHMADGSVIDNIEIKESTLYNFVYGVLQQQNNSGQASYTQSIAFEGCTFHNFGEDKYFANFKNQSGGQFSFKNWILGKVKNSAKFADIQGTFGSNPTATSTFSTTDYGVKNTTKIKSIVSTGLSSEELFEDAENGNFRVMNATYAGSGDPRWN